MTGDHAPATQHQVLFCPFCRESFEAVRRCPDHELDLVPWHSLPRTPSPPDDNARLAPFDLRFGRGWVLLGALFTIAAFLLPVLTISGETDLHANMFKFASLRAGKLWMVPLSAIAQLMLLFRRRTPRGMRSARIAAFVIGLMPAFALATTLHGVKQAVDAVAARTGQLTTITLELGSYLVFGAALITVFGVARLGVLPPFDEGAAHDEPA